MGNGCGGNGNCCGNNDVGDSNINRMAVAAGMMMTMTAAAATVATVMTMPVTMMVVAAVAEAASVAAPMVRAKANPQPHPNPQQYFRFIPFWNIPPIPNNMSYFTHIGIQYKQKIVLIRNYYKPHTYIRT
jgi:hypothetical protein